MNNETQYLTDVITILLINQKHLTAQLDALQALNRDLVKSQANTVNVLDNILEALHD